MYPFLLVFFVVFAVLEKTKVFGAEKKQINALTAFVIGLIFVAAVEPKLIVENLILFLSVAIVVVFVVLILWSFASGGEGFKLEAKWLKWVVGIAIIGAVAVAMFLITGVWDTVVDTVFRSDWSSDFWVNVIFIVIIALALALMMKKAKP
ncbi:hypothetical protein HYT23_02690 [Candidatus Pacearchaeota archaeon]|nr:hypothetical protein [Candidatus Pacearchaeota archaeon]